MSNNISTSFKNDIILDNNKSIGWLKYNPNGSNSFVKQNLIKLNKQNNIEVKNNTNDILINPDASDTGKILINTNLGIGFTDSAIVHSDITLNNNAKISNTQKTGSISLIGGIDETPDTGSRITLRGSNNSNGDLSVYTSKSGTIKFYSAGEHSQEKIRLSNSGNVIFTPNSGIQKLKVHKDGVDINQKLNVTGDINYTGTLYVNDEIFYKTLFGFDESGNIFYTSGNVGIGVTTPSELLHVNGNIQSDNTVIAPTFTGSNLWVSENIKGQNLISTNITTTNLQVSEDIVVTGNQNITGQLSVDNSINTLGNIITSSTGIGIGTDNPQAKLDVNGNIRINSGNLRTSFIGNNFTIGDSIDSRGVATFNATRTTQYSEDTDPSDDNRVFIMQNPTTNSNNNVYTGITLQVSPTGNLYGGHRILGDIRFIRQTNSRPVYMFSSFIEGSYKDLFQIGSNISYIKYSKFGIGKTHPDESLDVVGNIRSDDTVIAPTFTGSNLWVSENIKSQNLISTNTTTTNLSVLEDVIVSGHLTADNSLNTIGNIITTSTGVGVGTSSPQHTLDVNGSINSSENVYARKKILIGENLTDSDFDLLVDGLFRMQYDSVHQIEFSTPGGKTGLAFNPDEIGDYSRFDIRNQSSINLNDRYFNLSYNVDNLNGLTIRRGGNIGIGKTRPDESLDVVGNIRSDDTVIAPTFTGSNLWVSENIKGKNLISTNTTTTNLSVSEDIVITGNQSLTGHLTGENSVNTLGNIITTSTGVGVGTSSPQHTLDINGDIASNSTILAPTFTGSNLSISEKIISQNNISINSTINNLQVINNSSILGTVYIGEKNGTGSIFLGGGDSADESYNHSVIETRKYSEPESTELLLFKGNDSDNVNGPDRIRLKAGVIAFDTYPDKSGGTLDRISENIRMYINEQGNVGIGVTTPSELLHVNGNIKSDNIVIAPTFTGSNLWVSEKINSQNLISTNTTTTNLSVSEDIVITGNQSLTGHLTGENSVNTLGNIITTSTGVGVGTSSPQHTLDVNGDIASNSTILAPTFTGSNLWVSEKINTDRLIAFDTTTTNFQCSNLATIGSLQIDSGNFQVGKNDDYGRFYTEYNKFDVGSGRSWVVEEYDDWCGAVFQQTVTGKYTTLRFQNNTFDIINNDGSNSHRDFTFTRTGLGIKNSSPQHTLDVNGSINSSENVYARKRILIGENLTDSDFNLLVDGLFRMQYDSVHQIEFTTPAGKTGLAFNPDEIGDYSRFDIRNQNSINLNGRYFNLSYNDDNLNGLTIRRGGNIGIGKTHPDESLDVVGNIRSDDTVIAPTFTGSNLWVSETINSQNSISINATTTNLRVSEDIVIAGNQSLTGHLTGENSVNTLGNIITTSTGVGIKNTSPEYSLDVSGIMRSSKIIAGTGGIIMTRQFDSNLTVTGIESINGILRFKNFSGNDGFLFQAGDGSTTVFRIKDSYSSLFSVQYSSGNTSIKGNANIGNDLFVNNNATINGDLTLGGDLYVSGTTVTVNSETLDIKDNTLVVNAGPLGVKDAGIMFSRHVSSIITDTPVTSGSITSDGSDTSIPRPDSLTDNYRGYWINVKNGNTDLGSAQIDNTSGNFTFYTTGNTLQTNIPIGSTIYLYNRSNAGIYFDEPDKKFVFGYVADIEDPKTHLENNSEFMTVKTGDIISAGDITAGSLELSGDISSNTISVEKITVGNLWVSENIHSNGTVKSSVVDTDDLVVSNSGNINGNLNIEFGEDNTRVVGMSGFSSGKTGIFRFADMYNQLESTYGGTMKLRGYHGVQIFSKSGVEVSRFGLSSSGGWDNSYFRGKLGIGMSDPIYKLDVNSGSVRFGKIDTNEYRIDLGTRNDTGSSTYRSAYIDGSSNGNLTILNQNQSGSIRLGAGNNTSFYLNETGNVGIGKTHPDESLDVVGNIRSDDTVIAPTFTGSNLWVSENIKGQNLISTNITTTNLQVSEDIIVSGNLIAENSVNTLGNIITSSTGVGIGTSSPKEKLEVNGNILVNSGSKITIKYDGSDFRPSPTRIRKLELLNSDENNNNGFTFDLESKNYTGSGLEEGVLLINKFSGDINFITLKGISNKVGIFNTNPSHALDVNGNIASNSTILAPTFTGGNLSISEKIISQNNTSINSTINNLRVENDSTILGSVYIGEKNGTGSIFLGGGDSADESYNHSVIETRKYAEYEKTELLLFKGNDSDNVNGPDRIRLRAGVIAFDTYPDKSGGTLDRISENIRMYINEQGNVGIGVTTPSELLHVNGNIKSDNIVIAPTFTGSNLWVSETINSQNSISINATTTNLRVSEDIIVSGNLIAENSVNTLGNIITSSTGIGIGTDNPQAKLDVNGETNINGSLILRGGKTSYKANSDDNNVENTYITFTDSTAYSDRAYLRQLGTNNEFMLTLDFHDDGNDAGFQIRDVKSLENPDQITTRFIVNRGGNVGIGMSHPQAKLDVNGNIRSDYRVIAPTFTGSNLWVSENIKGKNLISTNTTTTNLSVIEDVIVSGDITSSGIIESQSLSSGSLQLSGDITAGGLNVSGNIIPSSNEAYDLGSDTNRFRDLYLSGNTIKLGNETISSDDEGISIRSLKIGQRNSSNQKIIKLDDDGNIEMPNFRVKGNSPGDTPMDLLEKFSEIDQNIFWTEHNNNISYISGNVGIGTINPQAKLDVSGDISGGSLELSGDITAGGLNVETITASGAIESQSLSSGSLQLSGDITAGGLNVETITVSGVIESQTLSSGSLELSGGITAGRLNTETITASGIIESQSLSAGSLELSGDITAGSINVISLDASDTVECETLRTNNLESVSDIRIKKDINKMQNIDCMNLLKDIEIYNFKFTESKDIDNKSDNEYIGFIAQQTERYFSRAVKSKTGTLHNIGKNCNIYYNKNSECIIQVSDIDSEEIKQTITDLVDKKLELKGDKKHIITIKRVIDKNNYEINERIDTGNYLIVGEVVDDFRHIDKSILWSTAIGAINYLYKELENTKKELHELKNNFT